MADPLSLLREFHLKKKKVRNDGSNFVFDDLTCPKKTETNYKLQSRSKYYTIESIWFFLKNIDIPHLQYVLLASNEKIIPVSLPDRNQLAQYLNGEISTCKSIDPNKFPGALTKVYKRKLSDIQDNVERIETHGFNEEKNKNIDQLQSPSSFHTIQLLNTENNMDIKQPKNINTTDKELKSNALFEKLCLKLDLTNFDKSILNITYFQEDQLEIQQTINFERQIYTRNSVMASKNIRFDKDKMVHQLNKPISSEVLKPNLKTFNSSEKHYDRYDVSEDRHFQDKGIGLDDFQIDTRGSHIIQADKTDNVNEMYSIRKADKSLSSNNYVKADSTESTIPIIIVPSTPTSLISLYNVKTFLENGNFIPAEEVKASGMKKPYFVAIQRKINAKVIIYHVYDQILKFTPKHWDRVCCVFILGPSWQFKGFPYDGDPVRILNKYRGVFVGFNDPLFTVHDNIMKWDIQKLKINKRDRDMDITAFTEFWSDLDSFWAHKQSNLIMK